MAELRKITSFQSFSDMRAQEAASKIAEEKVAKKEALKAKFASVIDELEEIDNIDFNIHSIEEGNAFIYAAAKARQEGKDEFEFNGKKYKVTLKKDTGLKESEEIIEEVNEGKRETGKVVTAWKKTGVSDLASIAKIYADAMEDANFHEEMSTSKAIGSASKAKAKELGEKYQDISSAAGWSGYAIANGTVQYLNLIGEEGAASKLLAAITKYDLNESVELPASLELEEGNAFGDAVRKAKEAGEKEFEFEGETYKVEEDIEINESEKDEQVAMELYTQVAGPEGAYSEDELAKGDDKLFTKIVADAGHKGSKAKKIVDEFKKIATNESVEVNENYEVIYSDGVSAMKKFRTEQQALDFMKQTIDSNKKLRDIAVYKPGMHSTTQTELVVAFWGNGSYLDNVSKKDPKLAAKKLEESVEVNEAEIKSDEEFKEYAVSVLQKAFGDDYDEAKAMEVVDGILGKVDGDYGAAVGMLTSSLGESVEVNESCGECGQNPCECDSVEEKKADGTISDDEDERREALMAEIESAMDQLLSKIKADAEDIGGSFRSPGIMYDAKKIIDNKMKKFK
jgi:hypothetical protein